MTYVGEVSYFQVGEFDQEVSVLSRKLLEKLAHLLLLSLLLDLLLREG